MTVLVTGAAGQLGVEVVRALRSAKLPCHALGRHELDVRDPDAVLRTIDRLAPSVIVNCAAYTAVDRAESEEEEAFAVNAAGVRHVAAASCRVGAPLVHFSTDYVFSGASSQPYTEDDPTGPLNAYGRSKLAGEEAVRAHAPRHVMIRTSWLFGATGTNFVRSILFAMARGDPLRVVRDQIGCPTPAAALGESVASLASRLVVGSSPPWGTYHLCGTPPTTWFDFAVAIRSALPDRCRIQPVPIHAIRSHERSGAPRPPSSVLSTLRAERDLGCVPPDWAADLPVVVAQILKQMGPGPDG